MSIYILQKDLPTVKAGTEFTLHKDNKTMYELFPYNQNRDGYYYFMKSFVENNPDWFKLKEEKMNLGFPYSTGGCMGVCYKIFTQEKYDSELYRLVKEQLSDLFDNYRKV